MISTPHIFTEIYDIVLKVCKKKIIGFHYITYWDYVFYYLLGAIVCNLFGGFSSVYSNMDDTI